MTSLLIDTGVLYASLDRDDKAHTACRRLLLDTVDRRVLPAPILPEVDYWVAKHLGVGAMVALVRDILDGAYVVEDLVAADYTRVAEILDEYADQDVGFVDAAVLAVAERLDAKRVATLDHRHFAVLRPRHAAHLELVPEP